MTGYVNMHEVFALHPELEDMEDGEQVHYNHPNCEAGADTKKRLFIKRDENVWVAWCHHCNQKGYRKHGKVNHIKRRNREEVHKDLYLPADFTTDPALCHVLANAWYHKYGITNEERRHYRLGWSDKEQRAILPVWEQGELVCYQRRRLLPNDTGPKYTTARRVGSGNAVFNGGYGEGMSGDIMVLTEDILSAIVVGRQVTTTALLGVFLPEVQVPHVLRFSPIEVLIWLDDDNPAVRTAQRQIVRRLSPYAEVRKVTGMDRDPKELSDEAIKQLLRWTAHD